MGASLENNHRNIVLTGLARSGTTLTCQLLNKVPNTVALVEPISPGKFADVSSDHEAVADGIERYFQESRRMALRKGRIITKHVGGEIPDNTFASTRSEDGVRSKVTSKGEVSVGKKLEREFYLIIKQPGLFTALLPTLAKRFPCYVTIRNPLSVLASGSTVRAATKNTARRTKKQNPARRTKKDKNTPPAMLRYDKGLASAITAIPDHMERRLFSLSWQFERFKKELPEGHIIRYEDVVESGGKALSAIVPQARELDEPLSNRNLNELYDRDQMLEFGEKLLQSEGAYWHFYSRQDVEELLGQIT